MPFQNLTFTGTNLIHGIQRQDIDPTVIVTNGNSEYRTKSNRFPRYIWTIPGANVNPTLVASFRKLYQQVRGGQDSFKFVDRFQPSIANNILSFRSGTTWFLNIAYDSSTPGIHPIFHPGTLTVTKNGSASSGTFSVTTDGFPILTVSGSTGSDVIRVSGDIYFAVRFSSTPTFGIAALNQNQSAALLTMDDLTLQEVFEY